MYIVASLEYFPPLNTCRPQAAQKGQLLRQLFPEIRYIFTIVILKNKNSKFLKTVLIYCDNIQPKQNKRTFIIYLNLAEYQGNEVRRFHLKFCLGHFFKYLMSKFAGLDLPFLNIWPSSELLGLYGRAFLKTNS